MTQVDPPVHVTLKQLADEFKRLEKLFAEHARVIKAKLRELQGGEIKRNI